MMRRCVATFALLLHTALSGAAQLTPRLDDGMLSLLVESTAWPATLQKDLTSGLTNRILIRVTLMRGPGIMQQRAVEIAVRYDLWDERFAMTLTLDGVEGEARMVQSLNDMHAALGKLHLPHLFPGAALSSGQDYSLVTEVLLNPVDRERMEMIRKWVAENSIASADIGGRSAGGDLAVVIFNRIFEQYAKGADITAVWREASASQPFRLEELIDEGE